MKITFFGALIFSPFSEVNLLRVIYLLLENIPLPFGSLHFSSPHFSIFENLVHKFLYFFLHTCTRFYAFSLFLAQGLTKNMILIEFCKDMIFLSCVAQLMENYKGIILTIFVKIL